MMQMPLLVSKFLCYLEAAARMELARISRPCQNPFSNECQRGEGALNKSPGSFGGILSLFLPHLLVAVEAEATHLVAFIEIQIPKPTLKHLFWCWRSWAEGVSYHY
jgi:hypothetical protein